MIKMSSAKHPYADYDLSIYANHNVAIMGSSGAGKSTLLNILAGFLIPNPAVAPHYQLKLNGQDHRFSPPGQRPISMLFQSNNLFEHLTVYQNIAIGLNPNMKITEAQEMKLIMLCQRMGIDFLFDRKPAKLSGGQQQRVALARALLREKPILLLDEPFSALDEDLRQDMVVLVKECIAEAQLTCLMVTHSFADALNFADELIYIDAGKIQYQGSPAVFHEMRVNH